MDNISSIDKLSFPNSPSFESTSQGSLQGRRVSSDAIPQNHSDIYQSSMEQDLINEPPRKRAKPNDDPLEEKSKSAKPNNSQSSHDQNPVNLPAEKQTQLISIETTFQEEFLSYIREDPSIAGNYWRLATELSDGDSIELPDGTLTTKAGLLLKAIELDPNYAPAYCNLAATIPNGGGIQMPDGKRMTKQQLLIKAIELSQNNASGTYYHHLAFTIPDGGNIEMPDGKLMTKQQLILKAIEQKPHYFVYYDLAATIPNGGGIRMPDGRWMAKQQLLFTAIKKNPNYAEAYSLLAATYPNGGGIRMPDGRWMTKQQLLLTAIQLNPNHSPAYSNLAFTLNNSGSIELSNGTLMTKQQLCLKAIELDPNNALAYSSLVSTFSNSSINLPDGTSMTKKQLMLKAIELDKNFAPAYSNLATFLASGDSVELPDGTSMTQKQLMLKAIELDPNYFHTYYNLATTLNNNDSIILPNGTWTKLQLLLKAITLNPVYSSAYSALAAELSDEERIWINGAGTQMSKQQLCLIAIKLDPDNAQAYKYLADSLTPDNLAELNLPNSKLPELEMSEVLYVDGVAQLQLYLRTIEPLRKTKIQLYLKAIHLKPDYGQAYSKLADALGDDKSLYIKVPNGMSLNKPQLYLMGIAQSVNAESCYAFGKYLLDHSEDGDIDIPETEWELPIPNLKETFLDAIDEDGYDKDDEDDKAGKILDLAKDHLFTAIDLDPSDAKAYRALSEVVRKRIIDQRLTLPDGTSMTDLQLLLKAIELDPNLLSTEDMFDELYEHHQNERPITLNNGITLSISELANELIADISIIHSR